MKCGSVRISWGTLFCVVFKMLADESWRDTWYWVVNFALLFNKKRSLGCALFCYKARRKRLEHERSVGRNTRRSQRTQRTQRIGKDTRASSCFFTRRAADVVSEAINFTLSNDYELDNIITKQVIAYQRSRVLITYGGMGLCNLWKWSSAIAMIAMMSEPRWTSEWSYSLRHRHD